MRSPTRASRSGLELVIAFLLSASPGLAQVPSAKPSNAAVRVGPPVLVSGDLPLVSHAEPHLVIDPTDSEHLVGAAVVLPDSLPHRVDVFISFDGGDSWERSSLPGVEDTEAIDPWVTFQPDGTAVVTVLVDDHPMARPDGIAPAGIAVFRSADGGRTWDGPAITSYGLGSSYDQQKGRTFRGNADAAGRSAEPSQKRPHRGLKP